MPFKNLLDKSTPLKPCPFCGGKAVYRDKSAGFPIAPTVSCSSCGIGISKDYDWGPGALLCTDAVIRAWNRRV